MKGWTYRSSMSPTTSVEDWLMIGEMPLVSDAGMILRSMLKNEGLFHSKVEMETAISGDDGLPVGYDPVFYTVQDIADEIRQYRYAQAHGGHYADTQFS